LERSGCIFGLHQSARNLLFQVKLKDGLFIRALTSEILDHIAILNQWASRNSSTRSLNAFGLERNMP
jgi:hypothetical protein